MEDPMTASRSDEKPRARKKVPVKKRRKPIPDGIRTLCLTTMQRIRRLEEANDEGMVRCISCGKVMHWKEAQGGHYIPRTVRPTDIDPDNIWPQCPQCNGVRHGNLLDYRYRLSKRIGEERVRRLEDMRAAYYGDEEAMERLDPDDQKEVRRKRGKVYYAERYAELKAHLKELER